MKTITWDLIEQNQEGGEKEKKEKEIRAINCREKGRKK